MITKKYFETILPGNEPIITLSYNNANGEFNMGNHVRLYTGYQNDAYDDDFPGFLVNINDYHFKTFELIKEIFPDVTQVVMACPIFYRDNIQYIKKETEVEGYKLFPCADGEYSEYVREDDFIYLFRTYTNPYRFHLQRCMDYTILIDETDDETDLSDRYDNEEKPLFVPVKPYYQLTTEEYKQRKKENSIYRLNKEILRIFDAYHMNAIESNYYIGYDDSENFVWCEMEDDRYDFNDAQLKIHYGEKFYLFKLNKLWTDHGLDKSYYFLKFTTDKHEAEELYNKPLEYFIPYISIDADGEPFTDAYHGIENINSDDWKCEYELTECKVGEGIVEEIKNQRKTMTIKEAGY